MPHLHVFGFQRKRVNNLEQGHCFCALEWLQWIRFCRERGGGGRSCFSNSKKAILAFQAITQLINPSARAIYSSHSITFLVGLLSTIMFMLGAFKVVFLQDVCKLCIGNAHFLHGSWIQEQSEVSFNWTIWCGSLQKLFYDLGHALT